MDTHGAAPCDDLLRRVSQAADDLSTTFAAWFETKAWNHRTRLASCYRRGCRFVGRETTCDCENLFRGRKAPAFAGLLGRRKALKQTWECTVVQSRAQARTRENGMLLDAALDRSASHPHLEPDVSRQITGFAAAALDKQCELAGLTHYQASDPAGEAPTMPAVCAYEWKCVDPATVVMEPEPNTYVALPGIARAWAVRRSGTSPSRARVVALTEAGTARCTCPYFEFWGIPCRHVLFVFGRPQLDWLEVLWWKAVCLGKADKALWRFYERGQTRSLGPPVRDCPPCPAGDETPTVPVPRVISKRTHLHAVFDSSSELGAPGGARAAGAALFAVAPHSAAPKSKPQAAAYTDLMTISFDIKQAMRPALEAGHTDKVSQLAAVFCDALQALAMPAPDPAGQELGAEDSSRVCIVGDLTRARGNSSHVPAAWYDPSHGSRNPRNRANDRTAMDTGVSSARGAVCGRNALEASSGGWTAGWGASPQNQM